MGDYNRTYSLALAEDSDDEIDDLPPAAEPSGALSPTLQGKVPADLAGSRLDAALARLFPEYSRSRLAQWIDEGRVRVDAAVAAGKLAKLKVWGGETVSVEVAPSRDEVAYRPEPVAFPVVYEDAALAVIDKPAGLVVHPGSGNWSGTLLNGLLHRWPDSAGVPRAGIVHRLDKDTSGLMVVARTVEAQLNLIRQLQARTVKREYLALVHGRLQRGGTVDAPIGRHPTRRTEMAVVSGGKPALTHYEPLEALAAATLVRCRLETGRTHQIRVHMTHLGHPLLGDPVYLLRRYAGSGPAFARQALHAARLGLLHPDDSREMAWESTLPEDFSDLLTRLRASEGETR